MIKRKKPTLDELLADLQVAKIQLDEADQSLHRAESDYKYASSYADASERHFYDICEKCHNDSGNSYISARQYASYKLDEAVKEKLSAGYVLNKAKHRYKKAKRIYEKLQREVESMQPQQ